MDFFFQPAGIALIGATTNPHKGGHSILRNLKHGYKGAIHPVNPRYDEILDMKCHKSVADVPDPVDIAIVFIPAAGVPDAVEQCAARGIKGVILECGGFAEAGAGGRELQARVDETRDRTGIRVWGPNCMGLVDANRDHVFSFVAPSIWDEGLLGGDVSLIVQSGMLSGGFLTDIMTHGTMGVSKVCSLGNKSDVDECDVLEYLLGDPDTKAVGMYLESVNDGRRFLSLCKKSDKPMVLLKGGMSTAGAKAAMSHTASMAGDGRVIRGAMAQAGVVMARDFKQMMDVCRSLAMSPPPRTPRGRIAVLTYSGGAGIMSSDFMEGTHLEVAELSDGAKEALAGVFPEWMPVNNPVDLWPAVERNGLNKVYGTAVQAVCDDPGVDAVMLHLFASGIVEPDVESLARVLRKSGKPAFGWLLGARDAARRMHVTMQENGVPVFRELYRAVECMDAVFARHANPAALAVSEFPPGGDRLELPPEAVRMLESRAGAMDEFDSKKILAAAGLPVVEESVAESMDAARGFAEKVGWPVVVKGLLPGEVHKTEHGLVRLGVDSGEKLGEAYAAVAGVLKGQGRVLLQKQVAGELELIAGLVRDPQFGPCVMAGLGGTLAEVLDDVVFAVAPLSLVDAVALLGRLRNRRLLEGFRGAPPVDVSAVADILVNLSRLGHAFEHVAEIDVNPLMIANGKPVAVDATVILR
ncbi:MAG: acetate--CoA ligase family protein [Desulfatibacillaceae bacterium]